MAEYLSDNVVTVVTVVLNDVDNIETTIQSILSQVGCNIEYIILDGGSSDGTLNVIRKYSNRVQYWQSSKDQGIYYAMNKGIEAATGDWIIFINSGDTFSHNNVVRNLVKRISPDDDIIYGQYMVKYRGGASRKVLPRRVTDMWKGTITSHQAVLIRSDLMKLHRFDCDFRLAADHELIAKLFHLGCSFHYVAEVIAEVSAGGASDKRRADVYLEFSRIAARFFPAKPFRSYFFLKRIDSYFRIAAKRVVPEKLVLKLQTRNRNKA